MRGLYAFRRNKALAACADQILAVRLTQRFTHKIEILRAAELQQCALHGLFFRRTRNVDRLSGARVKARIEHTGGQRARRGIEILHLFGLVVDVAQIFGQLDGSGKVAARMAGNQIGNEVLFLAEFLIDSFIFFTKRIVDIASRLAHDGEHLRADVLRRDFELAAT